MGFTSGSTQLANSVPGVFRWAQILLTQSHKHTWWRTTHRFMMRFRLLSERRVKLHLTNCKTPRKRNGQSNSTRPRQVQFLFSWCRYGRFFERGNSQLISDKVFPSLVLLLVERIRWGTETGDCQQRKRHTDTNTASNRGVCVWSITEQTLCLCYFPSEVIRCHKQLAETCRHKTHTDDANKQIFLIHVDCWNSHSCTVVKPVRQMWLWWLCL